MSEVKPTCGLRKKDDLSRSYVPKYDERIVQEISLFTTGEKP